MAGYFNSSILDAPDTAVRRILMKRETGQPLTNSEQRRLSERMSAEAETERSGGAVKQSVVPRRVSPLEEGQRQRKADDDFAAGYEGRSPASSTPAPGAPPAVPNGMSTGEATTAMRAQGPVNVNSYKGSMWAQPGSYAEARPNTESPSDRREQTADRILKRRFGTPPNEQDGAPATPSRETASDSVLRRRFGPPPDERNTVDVAASPVRRSPITPPPTANMANPSLGNVRRLSPDEIEENRRKGKVSQSPLRLPTL